MARRLPSGSSRLIRLLGVAVKEGAIPRGSVHRWREYKRRRQIKEILELLAGIQELVRFYDEVAAVREELGKAHRIQEEHMDEVMKGLAHMSRKSVSPEGWMSSVVAVEMSDS